jgi:hypothetical protein
MSTLGIVFCPDYAGSQATGLVGSIATTANTGPIQLGKYRIFKVVMVDAGTPATPPVLRFTLGNSTGTVAPTPTSASPFMHASQENIFELNGSYDQINLANLAADNGAITVGYCIIPLAKS